MSPSPHNPSDLVVFGLVAMAIAGLVVALVMPYALGGWR